MMLTNEVTNECYNAISDLREFFELNFSNEMGMLKKHTNYIWEFDTNNITKESLYKLEFHRQLLMTILENHFEYNTFLTIYSAISSYTGKIWKMANTKWTNIT